MSVAVLSHGVTFSSGGGWVSEHVVQRALCVALVLREEYREEGGPSEPPVRGCFTVVRGEAELQLALCSGAADSQPCIATSAGNVAGRVLPGCRARGCRTCIWDTEPFCRESLCTMSKSNSDTDD
jgi:hypothetical protein